MDLAELEAELALLDAVYRRVATRPVDPDARDDLGTAVWAELAALGVDDQAEAALRVAIEAYAAGDDTVRVAVRRLFDRYPSFRWAAHLPPEWDSAADFRDRLIHLSARDQGADTRDEILALRDLCDRARRAGIDPRPILAEVAALSSDVDRYGMGSMRDVILRYGEA